jgi:hypothetical protein
LSKQIIVHNLAESKGEIGKDMDRRNDLKNRQVGNPEPRHEGVNDSAAGPVHAPFIVTSSRRHSTSSQMRAVDMRNDFEQEAWRIKLSFDLRQISFAMFVAHCAGRDAKRSIIQGSDKSLEGDGPWQDGLAK